MMTLADIMNLEPCGEYSRDRVKTLMNGKKSVSAIDVINAELDSLKDNLWLVLRTEFLPEKLLHEVVIYSAELVLHIYEKEYPDDSRPREAVGAKKKWLAGEITHDELISARAAAWAARAAARDAARAAASDAAWAAAGDAWAAAWAAARAAARDAASDEINKKIIDYIRNKIVKGA